MARVWERGAGAVAVRPRRHRTAAAPHAVAGVLALMHRWQKALVGAAVRAAVVAVRPYGWARSSARWERLHEDGTGAVDGHDCAMRGVRDRAEY